MDKINLINIIGIIAVFISLLLVFVLVTFKTKNTTSNRLFATFLILTTIDLSGLFIYSMVNIVPEFDMLRSLTIFLQLPVFYLYVQSVLYSNFKLISKHLIHCIPFIIANLILIPGFYSANPSLKIMFLEQLKDRIEIQFNHVFIHLTIAFYIILIFRILIRYRKLYLENYTGNTIILYKWLYQFTFALTIFHSIALFKNIFKFSEYENISEWIKALLGFTQLGIVCWYLIKSLKYPDLFRGIHSKLQLTSNYTTENKTTLEDNDQIIQLKTFMSEEEPFLDPSLTIQQLADKIKIPVRELSILINRKMGTHFFDFVNEYRIEKAMLLLKKPSKSKFTVLEILYEVGFNSKSSFNTAFKKHTGTTPTAYRKA